MRSLVSLMLLGTVAWAQHFEAPSTETGWTRTLRAYGLLPQPLEGAASTPAVLVAKSPPEAGLAARVNEGLVVVLNGHSALAKQWGIEATKDTVEVRQIRDTTRPALPLIWAKSETLVRAKLSGDWQVAAWERWSGAPLLAIRRIGKGAVLWTATSIGTAGYEKFPYLPQALRRIGVPASAEARNLSAFFDASHRLRADIPYLVERWRGAGIATIHVTSWQFDGAAADRADWLAHLIETCHRNGIAVYAWLELPHVSDVFWEAHPECREKTLAGTEAHLDWRRLINLVNPKCAVEAEKSVLTLLRSYDWDGANLGELYFESLEGYANPSRFTPFSTDAVEYFRKKLGEDPREVLADAQKRQGFLDQRATLAAELQNQWLARLKQVRANRPDFDIMLTHIDDRLDTSMRNALGADSARLLNATEGQDIAFLIEDPATVWHLGPERYREIRKRYDGLTKEPHRLAIDLNIVERYQDVYPTKQQTGTELSQLVHEAAQNFDQVALYFEASLLPEDLPFLAPAAARLANWIRKDDSVSVELPGASWVAFVGPALVNGKPWPLAKDGFLFLPPGSHEIRPAAVPANLEFDASNLAPEALTRQTDGWDLQYSARTQAWLFAKQAFEAKLEDGKIRTARLASSGLWIVNLPRGEHRRVHLRTLEIPSGTLPASSLPSPEHN